VVVIEGSASLRTGCCHVGEHFVTPLDAGTTRLIAADVPFRAVDVPIQPLVVADLLPALDATQPFTRAVAEIPAEALAALLRLSAAAHNPADRHVLAASLERELYWRLLSGPLGEAVSRIGRIDSRRTIVQNALRWMEENYADGFRVADVARHVGVSESTLNRCFRAVTELSPMQHQKRIRLYEARRRLAATGQPVGRVAHDVGYGSASQFSKDYRQLFGISPKRRSHTYARTGAPGSSL
jgi:AraC-like DNA-binding protein